MQVNNLQITTFNRRENDLFPQQGNKVTPELLRDSTKRHLQQTINSISSCFSKRIRAYKVCGTREHSSVVNSNNTDLWHVILEGKAPQSELLAIECILSFTQSVHYDSTSVASNEYLPGSI